MIYEITVLGKPVPKPRMTRRDKWLRPPRPCVERFWHYAANIQEAYITGQRYKYKGDVAMGFKFYRSGWKGDLKNFIAGVEDALNGWAYHDDKQVKKYIYAEIIQCKKGEERTEIQLKEVS